MWTQASHTDQPTHLHSSTHPHPYPFPYTQGLNEINDVGVDLYWLREAELKHCSLGMLAAAGTYVYLWVGLGGVGGWVGGLSEWGSKRGGMKRRRKRWMWES